jgi:hypothetical protein
MTSELDHLGNNKYLVISLGKSGANWLYNLIGSLPDIQKLDMTEAGISGSSADELGMLPIGHVMYSHIWHLKKVIDKIIANNITTFYIYRDIRDVLVSEYYHKKHMDPERFEEIFPILKLVNDKTAFDLDIIMQWSTTVLYYNDVFAWVNDKKFSSIRYEDLIVRPEHEIKMAFEHYGINLSKEEISSAVSSASFPAMSGRDAGVENLTSHYRKGIVGDWRNHFSVNQADEFMGWFGPVLNLLGYDSR